MFVFYFLFFCLNVGIHLSVNLNACFSQHTIYLLYSIDNIAFDYAKTVNVF